MPKNPEHLTTGLVSSYELRAERRRIIQKALLDSFPAQIDAIKEERELALIELRRSMLKLETEQTIKRSNTARLNGQKLSVNR